MRVDDERQEPAYPAGGAPGSVDDDNGRSPETAAHPGWAPPEHYTATGERRGEPPGPVETGGHYDPGPGEQPGTGAEEAAVEDVDGGEFPPDDYLQQPGGSGTDGTTYGHPAAEATGGAPVDEVSAGEPAVGVAHVPPDGSAPADEPAAPDTREAGTSAAAEPEPAEAGPAAEAEPQAEDQPQAEAGPEPEAGLAPEELAPGEVAAEPVAAFWQLEVVDGFRDRWQQIQLRFIDDPRAAAHQAQALVTDVIQGFTEAATRQRGELDRWQGAELDDTEELRMTVRRYRDLLDRLLAL